MKKIFLFISILTFSCTSKIQTNLEMISIINKSEKAEFIMGTTKEELKLQPHRENDPDYYFDDEYDHMVILTVPYSMSKYEITNSQYIKVLNYAIETKRAFIKNGDVFDEYNRKLLGVTHLIDNKYLGVQRGLRINNNRLKVIPGQEECPVHAVTWIGTIVFCNILSELHNLEPVYNLKNLSWDESKYGYRLPTEAEWEYAARKNERYIYAWGNNYGPEFCCTSDYNDSIGWENFFTTVGYFNGSLREKFQTKDNSSPFGIYDMTGNVWEWCWDWYSRTYFQNSPLTDPKGPKQGETRPPYDKTEPTKVWRGCGFAGTAEYSRITKRWSTSTQMCINEVGFRIVKTIE